MGKSQNSLNSRPAIEFQDFAETKKDKENKHEQEKNLEWKHKKEISENWTELKKKTRRLEEMKTRKTQYIYLLFVFSLLSDWWN